MSALEPLRPEGQSTDRASGTLAPVPTALATADLANATASFADVQEALDREAAVIGNGLSPPSGAAGSVTSASDEAHQPITVFEGDGTTAHPSADLKTDAPADRAPAAEVFQPALNLEQGESLSLSDSGAAVAASLGATTEPPRIPNFDPAAVDHGDIGGLIDTQPLVGVDLVPTIHDSEDAFAALDFNAALTSDTAGVARRPTDTTDALVPNSTSEVVGGDRVTAGAVEGDAAEYGGPLPDALANSSSDGHAPEMSATLNQHVAAADPVAETPPDDGANPVPPAALIAPSSGAYFVDVVALARYGVSNADMVQAVFAGQEHQLPH
jgi:hypothetical protein